MNSIDKGLKNVFILLVENSHFVVLPWIGKLWFAESSSTYEIIANYCKCGISKKCMLLGFSDNRLNVIADAGPFENFTGLKSKFVS